MAMGEDAGRCRRAGALSIVLAGTLSVAVLALAHGCRKPGPRPRLEIKALSVALTQYRRILGAYPPDDITLVVGSAENGMSEVLVYYLGRKLKKGVNSYGPYFDFSKLRLTDADGDGFPEYVNPWGNPYLYAENASHKTPVGMMPKSFDLVSPGRDGELGGTMSPETGYVPATTPKGKAREADNITN